MAFRTQKISQMTPKGADLEATDLIEVSTIESGSYVTRSITGQELIDAIPPTTIEWGDIGGTLSDQTDLNTALNAKVPTSRTLTINGVTQDLSANRTFTISTGITIGSTAIASGVVGRVLFEGAGNVVQESSSLTFNDTTKAFLLSGNQNNTTLFTISNTTAGTLSNPALQLISDNSAGQAQVFKYSSTRTPYKSIEASDFGHYNATAGDISFLNDVVNGKIKFATNQSNTAQMTLAASGNVLINTTTDAGFRLDVNGTARVQGNATIGSTSIGQTQLNIFSSSRADLRLKSNGSSDNSFSLYTLGGSFGSCYAQFGTNDGENAANQGGAIYTDSRTGIAPPIRLLVKATGTLAMTNAVSVFNTANVGINTTTDAGFRLDVNGTARVDQTLQLNGTGTGTLIAMGGNIGRFTIDGSFIRFKVSGGGDILNMTTNFFGVNETSVIPSAICAMTSTNRGFLPPRMTTTQKNAIATPATGLQVYDTTLNRPCFYDGTTWITL